MSDPRDDAEDGELIEAEGPDVETSEQGTGEYGAGVDRDTGADVGDTGEPELRANPT
jgi:hypothetical protein